MKLWQWAFVGILLVVFVLLSYLSVKQESLTYDEIVYSQEGNAIFSTGNFSIDPYNPPLIKEILHFGGRATTIVLGCILLLSVFLVTKSYIGVPQAFFALYLLVFEPNLLGNSHYVTLDVGFTLFFFLSYVALLNALKSPSVKNAIVLGITIGLALGSKISGLTYFFLSAGLVCWIKRAIPKYVTLTLIISLLVLWAVYFFQSDVIVVKHDDPNRVSSKLLAYANAHNITPLSWVIERLQNQKVPLGRYISVVKNNVIRSRSAGNTVPWYVMFRNVLLKTPLPLILFFLFALRKKILVFIIPIFAVLVVSSVSHMSPWVRYVLPVYPFAVLIASNSLKEFKGIYRNLVFIVLVVWYAIGTANQFPHFISYANELAGPREKRYEKFVDSNIDWGQGLISLQKYMTVKKPRRLLVSYFGRDDGDRYGFTSDRPWGSWKFEEICAFHSIDYPKNSGPPLTTISISNWYSCGYSTQKNYSTANIVDVVGDSILIFTY